jgi:hypothetical protein
MNLNIITIINNLIMKSVLFFNCLKFHYLITLFFINIVALYYNFIVLTFVILILYMDILCIYSLVIFII